jgi:hypothetical protein
MRSEVTTPKVNEQCRFLLALTPLQLRYSKQVTDPDCSSEKNVNGSEGKRRQIPHEMNEDSRESRMSFREDRFPREQYDEVSTPPKSQLNSNECWKSAEHRN